MKHIVLAVRDQDDMCHKKQENLFTYTAKQSKISWLRDQSVNEMSDNTTNFRVVHIVQTNMSTTHTTITTRLMK